MMQQSIKYLNTTNDTFVAKVHNDQYICKSCDDL